MIFFELLYLAIAGRVVIQADFNPRTAGLAYGLLFAIADLAVGAPIAAIVVGRLLSAGLAEVHFRSLVRFSGLRFLAALIFGAMIPGIVIVAKDWVLGPSS